MMPACAKRVALLAEIERSKSARFTVEIAEGTEAHAQKRFVVLRSLRRSPVGEWKQRKSFAVLPGELHDVAAALLRAAR